MTASQIVICSILILSQLIISINTRNQFETNSITNTNNINKHKIIKHDAKQWRLINNHRHQTPDRKILSHELSIFIDHEGSVSEYIVPSEATVGELKSAAKLGSQVTLIMGLTSLDNDAMLLSDAGICSESRLSTVTKRIGFDPSNKSNAWTIDDNDNCKAFIQSAGLDPFQYLYLNTVVKPSDDVVYCWKVTFIDTVSDPSIPYFQLGIVPKRKTGVQRVLESKNGIIMLQGELSRWTETERHSRWSDVNTIDQGDVVSVYVDTKNKKIWFKKNHERMNVEFKIRNDVEYLFFLMMNREGDSPYHVESAFEIIQEPIQEENHIRIASTYRELICCILAMAAVLLILMFYVIFY